MNYLDRYFKYSVFLWSNTKIINEKREEVLKNQIRTKFYAAVISNSNWNNFRNKFINELNKYKKVDMGGRFRNNITLFLKILYIYIINDESKRLLEVV